MRRRPFLVLHRNPVAAAIYNIVVAPITTTNRGLSSHFRLGPEDGLRRESWVNFDSITTIKREWLVSRVAALSPERSRQACATMAYALGCVLSAPGW
jgi:mRNA interferase MazF